MGKQHYQKICLNGHQITDWYLSSSNPDPSEYCQECGKQVIVTCLKCNNPILGQHEDSLILGYTCPVPNYCKYCAAPYPWTELVFRTTEELISLDDEISENNKNLIKDSIPDLLVDTPKTKLAIAKFKKGIQTASLIVKDALRDLLVDVLSETAKKAIYPD